MEKSIKLNELTMGVCYYPEHWSEDLWESDLKRMTNAGIKVIRIAEFAWNKFEPQEGIFTFDFFDHFMDVVSKTPIKVIFCTPTATPAAWLTEKYPEVLCVDLDGRIQRHGLRRHYNYNSEVYKEKTKIIVDNLANHYEGHPSIIGWQIDNEFNCGPYEFYADADHNAFREYVKEKYITLENLNKSWGCVFWNQEYTKWEEVFLPRHTGGDITNPHLKLDSIRFYSLSTINYCKLQYDILRLYLPADKFITTNGIFGHIDYNEMVDTALDFITYDSYPTFGLNEGSSNTLLDRKWSSHLSKVRAISPNFGIMEQQSGPGGWVNYLKVPTPKPGQVRLWTFQSIAHGADFISYFRWRTCTFGTEIYWSGILSYDNKDNRRLEEITKISEDMQTVKDISGSKYQAEIAIICDYDNEWDGEFDTFHGPLRNASNENWFVALEVTHTPFDYINMSTKITLDTLKKYKLIVYPHPTIVTDYTAKLLEEYVAHGGNLIIGARSGYKDINGQCPMAEMPGKLSSLFGVTINDFTAMSDLEQDRHAIWDEDEIDMPLFNDIISPKSNTCTVLATYKEDYYAGQPALTVNRYGKGNAYYLGSAFSLNAAKKILTNLGYDEPYSNIIELPECCEIAIRTKGNTKYMFILNYNSIIETITLKKPLTNLLTNEILNGKVALEKYGVLILGF